MEIEDRILFLENGSPCIFFPVGKLADGGTCNFMTDECYENCPSCGVVHEHEIKALKYFKDNPIGEIVERIMKELSYFESTFLGWFSWGDCPPSLTEKIVEIVRRLNESGIIQNGFTRNKTLWEKIPCKNNLRFSLSVDTEKDANVSSNSKTVCFPDISRAEARVFFDGKMRARCSGYFCIHLDTNRTVEADCEQCYAGFNGCFSNGG